MKKVIDIGIIIIVLCAVPALSSRNPHDKSGKSSNNTDKNIDKVIKWLKGPNAPDCNEREKAVGRSNFLEKEIDRDKIAQWTDELNSPDYKKKGRAVREVLKYADEINVSIVRAAISVADEMEDFRTNPFLVRILLDEFMDEKCVFFDSSTRAFSGLALGDIMGHRGFQPENASTGTFNGSSPENIIGNRRSHQEDGEESEGEEAQGFVSENVIKALLKTLDPDEVLDIRLASAYALRNSCDENAYHVLRTIAENENEDPFLRIISVRSLSKMSSCLQVREGSGSNPGDYSVSDSLYTRELMEKFQSKIEELKNRIKFQ